MNRLSGKYFSIHVQGCRTNLYEGEAIAAALEARGAVRREEAPDIAVIVTCTITAVADRKCRKLIRRTRRENPNAVVAVCGCYAQKMADEERAQLGVDIVLGNRLKHMLPELIAESLGGAGPRIAVDGNIERENEWDRLSLDRPRLHSRAFLKVQDGCSHYCSYCIVPSVRGKPVSRPFDDAVEEARRVAASGCHEIVLTGVHLGLYDRLPELVRAVGAIPGITRLRFGSIEPFAVNDVLLSALAETAAFCPHLHMPLQSGDDGVLAAMRRGYTRERFAGVVEKARAVFGPDLHISTDLMVGFPTEDDAAFRGSLDFVKEMRFGKVHVFPYSPREGTPAAAMTQLPHDTVHARTEEALSAAAALHREFCSRCLGQPLTILVEECENGTASGLTRNYIRVSGRAQADIGCETAITPDIYDGEELTQSDLPGNGRRAGDVSAD